MFSVNTDSDADCRILVKWDREDSQRLVADYYG